MVLVLAERERERETRERRERREVREGNAPYLSLYPGPTLTPQYRLFFIANLHIETQLLLVPRVR